MLYGSFSRPLTPDDFSQFNSNWEPEYGKGANSKSWFAYSQDYQSVLEFGGYPEGWEDFAPTYITDIRAEGNTVSVFNRTYNTGDYANGVSELYYNGNFIQKESFARQYYYEQKGNQYISLMCEAEYIFTRNTDGSFNLKSLNIIS